MGLSREIPLSDGDGRLRLEMPVAPLAGDDSPGDSGSPAVDAGHYQRIELWQQDEDLFEAYGFGNLLPETLASGALDDLRSQFPQAEVLTCDALGGDECTILPGESRCQICQS